MKIILPWLLAVLAAGGAVFFYQSNQTKTGELAKLQPQLQELETLRAENEGLKRNQIAPEELARLNESKDELLRLRNEVRQLRTDKTQLNQQAQAAKTAAEQAQAVAAQAQETATKAVTDQQAAIMAARRAAIAPAVINACLNNLRQLDAAKLQWALENHKSAEAVPTDRDLASYIRDNLIPACPGGGKYTFGNLSTLPTCTVAGHILPPP